MSDDEFIRRRIRKLKELHPGLDADQLEKELIPVSGDDVNIKVSKKKKNL